MCLGFVLMMTLANLRGLKESGRLFAGPTYVYVIMLVTMIVVGLVRRSTGHLEALPPNQEAIDHFYSPTIESVEAVAMPGMEQTQRGVAKIKGRNQW